MVAAVISQIQIRASIIQTVTIGVPDISVVTLDQIHQKPVHPNNIPMCL
jgi:hypothetical protein